MATVRHIGHEPMTLEEFLEFEQQSEVRREYVEDGVYAFAGGTYEHGLIGLNIAATLRRPAFRLGCLTFGSDSCSGPQPTSSTIRTSQSFAIPNKTLGDLW